MNACIAVSALGLVLAAAPASAGDNWGAAVGAVSRYVFRGVAQSGSAAAVHADLHWRLTQGWYVGGWTSTLDRKANFYGRHELDLYVGRGWALDDALNAGLRLVHYAYPGSPRGDLYDWDELAATLDVDGRLQIGLSYSPNSTRFGNGQLAVRQRSVSVEASGRQPLGGPLALVAAAGWYDTRSSFGSGYRAWNLGFSAQLGRTELSVGRFDTDRRARSLFEGAAVHRRWVLSVVHRF